MQIVKLNKADIKYLEEKYPQLSYNITDNIIEGLLFFYIQFDNYDPIKDYYNIEINLNKVSDNGIPAIRERANKILNIAKNKRLSHLDLHINNTDGEICIIIPPKEKERYPNGFNLKELLHHIEEHLYWISYFDKYNVKPWDEYGHDELGYLQLYLENPKMYSKDVKKYFRCNTKSEFKRKIKELRKKYKI